MQVRQKRESFSCGGGGGGCLQSFRHRAFTLPTTTDPYMQRVLHSRASREQTDGATPATTGPPPPSHCLRSEKQETVKNINNGGDSWSTSSALHHHHHHHHPVDLNAPNHHLHHQNGLGGIWNQYQPPLPSVYNTFGVFPTSDWHLVAPSAYDATDGGGNSVQPVSNLLATNVPTTQLISTTCATDGVTQENFPPHGEEEIVVEADPWNVNPEQPATADQEMNADWSTPDVNWSNAANDDWQAPAAPVKPAPTYFNDSSDDFVSSSGIRQVSSTTDLSNGNNKKSRRRRRKKQNEMVADVEKQQTSSSSSPPPPSTIVDTATTVAEVVMKQQEVIASQLDDDDASAAVTVGTESDGEWTTPSLLKKRRSRARKED